LQIDDPERDPSTLWIQPCHEYRGYHIVCVCGSERTA
jgi:hypothetical protein